MSSSHKGKGKFSNSVGDTRNDLGYGRLAAKFHKERLHGGPTFPYSEPPKNLEDIEIDEELLNLIINKTETPASHDPLASNTRSQYYVSGNSKMSEIATATNSMVPIPDLYKNRARSASGPSGRYPQGPSAGFTSKVRPTGSKRGYSTMHNNTDKSDAPAYTIEDILDKQIEEIREYVRQILLMELG